MNYFRKFLNLIIALVGLNFVILIHEFGHFVFCKAFDVGTPTFSVGFDPAITSHKFRGTKFQIGAIPLGGYVAINEQDLASRSYPKKMAIIFAGILFNVIFGFLALYYLYSKRQQLLEQAIRDQGRFAHEQFEHQEFSTEESQEKKREYTEQHGLEGNEPVINRGGLRGFIAKATPAEARSLLINLSKNRFLGPIGIISAISQSVTLGFDTFLYFLATISLNIGFFNLLPLSFLDGGKAAYYTLQALFGNTFSSSFGGIIPHLMFALALLFLFLVSIKDIFNLRKSK